MAHASIAGTSCKLKHILIRFKPNHQLHGLVRKEPSTQPRSPRPLLAMHSVNVSRYTSLSVATAVTFPIEAFIAVWAAKRLLMEMGSNVVAHYTGLLSMEALAK